MKKPKLYRKLGSAHQFGVARGGWHSLYLAPDHLLLRTSSGFTESYRRFYFSDIEAITVCQTVRGIFWNAGFGIGLFISLVAMLTTRSPHYASAIFMGIFAIGLLVNSLRGTTCRAQLQTRVQTRALPLRRQRKALRIVEQLGSQIRAAQEQLAAVAVSETQRGSLPVRRTEVPRLAVPPPLPGENLPPQTTGLQLATVALLVLTGITVLWESWKPYFAVVSYFCYALILVNLGFGIAVLVQNRRRHLRSRLTPVAWVSVVVHAMGVPLVYMVFNFVFLARSMRTPPVNPAAVPQMGIGALRDLPGFTYVLICYGVFALLLGVIGLIILAMKSREEETESA